MNRKRLFFVGVLALSLASLVSYSVLRALRTIQASAMNANNPVVVAATDLAPGSKLEATHLRIVKLPSNAVAEGAFKSVAELEGRGVLVSIKENEPVLASKVASREAGAGLQVLIPSGKRAVAVRVNDVISVAGYVRAGTRVDVLLTGNPRKDMDPSHVTTTTVLENVEVLAAEQELDPTGKAKKDIQVITLLVTPEEAEKLTLASTTGLAGQSSIRLALRNPMDTQPTSPQPVRNATLYRLEEPVRHVVKAAKKAEVEVRTVYAVEIVRGDKREVATF